MNAHVELVRVALERVAAEGSHSLLEHHDAKAVLSWEEADAAAEGRARA